MRATRVRPMAYTHRHVVVCVRRGGVMLRTINHARAAAWPGLLALIVALLLSGCTAGAGAPGPAESASSAPAGNGSTGGGGQLAPDEPAPSSIRVSPATVVRVVDGDTAVFRLQGGAEEKVRFIGVDTPESTNRVEPYGEEAGNYTRSALSVGRQVYLEQDVEARDRYGRLLAYVWLDTPSAISDAEIRAKMFNAKLALDGYAQQMTIPPNVKYADYFRRYVAEARDSNAGMWGSGSSSTVGDPSAAAPPAASGGTAANYIGNRNSKKFHNPSCGSVDDMNPENKVPISSRKLAISSGFVPCKRCNP